MGSDINADPEHRPRHPLAVIYAADLECVRDKLVAVGEVISRKIFFPGGRLFHFNDPASNGLAVWYDRQG